MKKSLALASLMLASTVVSAHAAPTAGNGYFFKPYVGADYQYTQLLDDNAGGKRQAKSFETGLHGVNGHIGARIHKSWGAEIGFIENDEAKSGGTRIQEHGPYADVLHYYPIKQNMELIGALGVSKYHVLANNSNGTKNDEYSVRGRLGLGGQYWLGDHVNLRSIVRYEGEDFDGSNSNNSVQFTAGVNYQF